ncbi:MAG TPA: extracellular solute-binding protein [Terriglobales bacterium]|jgi:iron(III) transport system substrate-binding protein|nr:extracellular solute-binding protein [Terriglobales bacterium]
MASKPLLSFFLSATLALALANQLVAGQARPETDARFEKWAKEFYPKAKQEGALVVYTVWDVDHIRALTDGFAKRFPGINTSYWQATRSEVTARTLTEYQGNQATVDVILTEAPLVLHAAGATEAYSTVQANALIVHDAIAPVVSLQIQALAYNTKKLKREDAPKNWEDVTNPKYKGAVALDDPMRAGPLSSMLAAFKDEWKDDARWTRFIKGLKSLNVSIHKSTSAMFRLVVAGEYSIVMPSLFHDVVHEKELGSPIDFARGAAPVVSPQQAAIYAKAPHPTAAKLFAEWLISPEGQAAIDAVGRASSRKGFKSKTSIENGWGATVKPIVVANKAYIEDARKWLDTAVKPVWEN